MSRSISAGLVALVASGVLAAAPAAPAAAAVPAVAAASPSPAATAAVPAASAGSAGTATVIGGEELARPGVVVNTGPGVPAPPGVAAESWLLADITTGEVLAAHNAHERLRPASTLKTLTAVTLLPILDKQAVYTASNDDAAAEGSRVGIVPGATYTVDQLFLGMFLPSGNDAALALAHAAGGVEHTLELMNAEAEHLQARDTHAVTPNGLDEDGQFSSAYDLALIARDGLARPDFRTYVSTRSVAFPGKMPPAGKPRPTFMIYNQNRMLGRYDGALGVKTGYTTLAHSTFVGAAERGGHTLVVTIMKTGPRSWEAAEKLLDWGFAHRAAITPVGTLVDPVVPAPPQAASVTRVAGAAQASAVPESTGSSPALAVVWIGAGLLVAGVLARVRAVAVRRRRRYARRPARAPLP